jgi:hypothetical protein
MNSRLIVFARIPLVIVGGAAVDWLSMPAYPSPIVSGYDFPDSRGTPSIERMMSGARFQ